MKSWPSFKSIEHLKRRLQKDLCWADKIIIAGKTYTMTEYGPGPGIHIGYDYVEFTNKKTNDTIYIKYDCPSWQYIKGQKTQIKTYRFINLQTY